MVGRVRRLSCFSRLTAQGCWATAARLRSCSPLPAAFRGRRRAGRAAGDRALIRRLYGRPLDTLLATWGVGLVLQQAARSIFGAPNVQVSQPALAERRPRRRRPACCCPTSGCSSSAWRSSASSASTSTCTARRSGRRMRAVMQNREMAACLGVATRRVDALDLRARRGPGRRRRLRADAARPDRPVARHLLHRRCLHGRRAGRRRAAARDDRGRASDRRLQHGPRAGQHGHAGQGAGLRPDHRLPAVAAGRVWLPCAGAKRIESVWTFPSNKPSALAACRPG